MLFADGAWAILENPPSGQNIIASFYTQNLNSIVMNELKQVISLSLHVFVFNEPFIEQMFLVWQFDKKNQYKINASIF